MHGRVCGEGRSLNLLNHGGRRRRIYRIEPSVILRPFSCRAPSSEGGTERVSCIYRGRRGEPTAHTNRGISALGSAAAATLVVVGARFRQIDKNEILVSCVSSKKHSHEINLQVR